MGSHKKIGLSHEMGLIDTTPLKAICPLFPEKKGLVFTMNKHGGHVGHVTWTVFPQLKEALYIKFCYNRPSGF